MLPHAAILGKHVPVTVTVSGWAVWLGAVTPCADCDPNAAKVHHRGHPSRQQSAYHRRCWCCDRAQLQSWCRQWSTPYQLVKWHTFKQPRTTEPGPNKHVSHLGFPGSQPIRSNHWNQDARLMAHAPISTKLPSFTVRQGIRPVVVRRLRSARRRSCQMAAAGGLAVDFWGERKQPVVLANSSGCTKWDLKKACSNNQTL